MSGQPRNNNSQHLNANKEDERVTIDNDYANSVKPTRSDQFSNQTVKRRSSSYSKQPNSQQESNFKNSNQENIYPKQEQESAFLQRQLDELLVERVGGAGSEMKWKELRELDEEELYIKRLRQQRKKIDLIQGEFEKKIDYYTDLERDVKELSKYKVYYDKYKQLQEVTEETLKRLEVANQKVEELKQFKEKGKQAFQNQQKLEVEYERILIENTILKKREEDLEAQLRIQHCKFQEIDEMIEKQTFQTKVENSKLMAELTQLRSLSEQLIQERQQSNNLSQQLKIKESYLQESRKETEREKEEKQIIVREISRKSEEIETLKTKLADLTTKHSISSSKATMLEDELKSRESKLSINTDDLKITLFQKEEELMKSRLLNQQLSVEFDSAVKRMKSLESEIADYRRENYQLKVRASQQQVGFQQIQDKQLLIEELDALEKDILQNFNKPRQNNLKRVPSDSNSSTSNNHNQKKYANSSYNNNYNKYQNYNLANEPNINNNNLNNDDSYFH